LASSVEEERRLFYVGITRAKEHLLIIQVKQRYSYGQMVTQFPSRFLLEVQHLMPHEDISHATMLHAHHFFTKWLGVSSSKSSDIFVPRMNTAPQATKKISPQKTVGFSTNTPTSKTRKWQRNQPVKHEKYGIGTVQEIDERGSDTTYITVRFKTSVKKILSQFLQRL